MLMLKEQKQITQKDNGGITKIHFKLTQFVQKKVC